MGLGLLPSFAQVKQMLPAARVFIPRPDLRETYDRHFRVFTTLYKDNRKSFAALNRR